MNLNEKSNIKNRAKDIKLIMNVAMNVNRENAIF